MRGKRRSQIHDAVSGLNPICHMEQLQSIKEEWIEVHKESRLKSPLLSFEFISLWYNCFSSPDQIRIYKAFDGEKTIGFLPFILSQKKGIRKLKGLTNAHCCHSGCLCREGKETELPGLILDALLKDRHSWDILNLSFSWSFSEMQDLFSDLLLNSPGMHWNKITRPTYTVFLGKTFDRYFNNDLTTKLRKNIRLYTNRLKSAGNYRFINYQGEDALRLWNEFVRIEDSGWKGDINSSIKRSKPAVRRYYDGFVKILSDSKAINMYFLELNSKLIAGAFGYIEGGVYHYVKIGYDEKYKALSPSNLVFIHLVEHLIAYFPEVKRINMLPLDYGYKHRFINEESNYLETFIFGKTIRGKILKEVYSIKEKIKCILKHMNLRKSCNPKEPRIWKSN